MYYTVLGRNEEKYLSSLGQGSNRVEESAPLDYLQKHKYSEFDLQSLWFAGAFGRQFTTVCGRTVEIIQLGEWNREPGPDFADVVVKLENREPEKGALEIDINLESWESHGHSTNPAFDRVLLHLFLDRKGATFFTRTSQNRLVPQVQLDLCTIQSPLPAQQPLARPGRCIPSLSKLSSSELQALLEGAAQHRLHQKSRRLRVVAEARGRQEALYEGLAETLGYKENKLPFTLLAQRFPLKTLRASSVPAEALLFGAAGFLGATDLSALPEDARSYLRVLWEQWWPHRVSHERLALSLEQWRLGGQRPVNHPHRRLAALAELVRSWKELMAVLEGGNPKDIYHFFSSLKHDYWSTHYTITSKSTPKPLALIGETRVAEMLANVVFPWIIAEQPSFWQTYSQLPAKLTNKRLELAAARLFGETPTEHKDIALKTIAGQQALLQIYEDFCIVDKSECANCPFPESLIDKWLPQLHCLSEQKRTPEKSA